jgi:hypothetical protein
VENRPSSAVSGNATSSQHPIIVFVEENKHRIQCVLAVRLSSQFAESPDTDLVAIGPAEVLASLPDDLVKISSSRPLTT